MKIITKDPNLIRKMGIELLSKELGPVGMAFFLRQYDMGEGDYTKERNELLKNISLGDIKGELRIKNDKTAHRQSTR